MTLSLFSAQRPAGAGRRFSVASFLLSLLAACLSSLFLFSPKITDGLVTTLIAVGLDPLRAQFVAALFITTGIAFIGGIVGRQKTGAMLGAIIAFGVGYLAAFVHLEQQPLRDPGGQLEALNSWALAHTSLMMIALAFLCAFVGAAVGVALYDVLLNPFFQLVTSVWQRIVRSEKTSFSKQASANRSSSAHPWIETVLSWLGAVAMLVSLVLASGSGSLFSFSPDVGLHTSPTLSSVHSTIVEDSVVSSALGGQKKPFMVYLPPSYSTSHGRTKRYPTLYLLHGSPGKDSDWFTGGRADQTADTLIALRKIPELILILPDGNGRAGETSEWGNSGDGRQLIETYVAIDLVKYVDQKYRTLAEPAYRGIGGNSMGAFGATNIAVHHPNIFGFVISLGGYYHAEGSIWGKNAAYIRANSPAGVLPHDKSAWTLRMYIGAATNDQPYYRDSLQFVHELDQLHIHYHFDLQKGYHAWSVWQAQLYNALLWFHAGP